MGSEMVTDSATVERAPSTLDAGRLLFGLGGLVLLVSTFLNWYGSGSDAVSAWTAFELADLVLATIGLAALASALAQLSSRRRLPEVAPAATTGLALVALAIVVANLIDPPPALFGSDLEVGAWLALGATVVMAIGGLLGTTAISITVARRERPAKAAVDPDAETRTFRAD